MRLITRLWATLLLLCVAGVANAATVYEVDQKFTSVAALDGQLFAIVNETDNKAVYNKDNQNLAYDTYANAVTGAAYLWKLHSLAEEGVEALENAYAIEAVKADGSSIGLWGNPAIFLNSGAEGGFDGCFVLGQNGQYGTDVQYGGVWEIEYDADKGFALKNVARGGYFAGVNPAPTGEEPIYWTFCTLKQAENDDPEPEPEPIPEPENTPALGAGELIPDFFSICDEGGIPYGYYVKFGSEERAYPATFGAGARMFNFAEGGDFTKAIYFREGYMEYGSTKTMRKLTLEAGKSYVVYFNSAMWKSSGATLEFSIFKEGESEAVYTQTINNTPDVNGSKDAVTGSTLTKIIFNPTEDGNYILRWDASGWREVLLANVGMKELEEFTATFTTNAGWEKAYAYAWSGDGAVKFLGDWPGTEMTPGNGGNDWKISIKAEEAPEKIIFNNGGNGAQTADLDFENGKAYEFNINNEWAEAIAAAQALAEEDGVAVGKLIAAIGVAQGITEPNDNQKAALQAAIDQYKLDNADQEKDETAKVNTSGWKKYDGSNAGVCQTQFAPAIDTYDGRKNVNLAEVYETTVETTGTIIYQDITGLANGKYKVGFYGNAFYTSGRGFDSTMEDGADDVAYVFANDQKEFITARIATSTTENNFRQFDVEVTDGQIKLGMGKEKPGTNWHTMQIYQLTWFTTAKEVFAELKNELSAKLFAAASLLDDETKTNGKEDLRAAVNAALTVKENSNMYNISEVEQTINNLTAAVETFTFVNRFIEFAAGEYYIIDAESGLKMAAGHNYGTRGIVNEIGLDLILTPYEESRTVTFDSRVSNGGNSHFLGENLYMDSGEWGWALEYQGFGFYILEPKAGKYINLDADNNLVLSDTPREWIIVTKEGVKETRLEEMAEATAENPVDATWMISGANFNRNDARNSAWEVSDNCTNKNLSGGNEVNNCAESFHSLFTISQVISGAPAGVYKLTAQGFYRQDAPEGAEEGFTEPVPVFFANNATAAVPAKTGEEGSMSAASESFTAGQYTIDPIEFTVGEDGTFTIGVKNEKALNQWVIFDNFQLTYFGKDMNIRSMAVVGDFTSGWDPEEGAVMTQNPENPAEWTLTISDFEVTFEEGQTERTYEYKVAANNQWSYYDLPANGNQNWRFAEGSDYPAGKYQLVFTANTANHTLTLTVTDMEKVGISTLSSEKNNGAIFNLNGQKVNKAQKGLYIMNGKKVFVK